MTVASTAREAGRAGPGESESRRADIKKERRDWRQYVGFVPAAILFGVFFIAPLCLIVVYSFWITKNYELVPAFTKEQLRHDHHDEHVREDVRQDGGDGVPGHDDRDGTGLPVLLLAGALRARRDCSGWGLLLVVLPFWTSYLLRVYAWVAISVATVRSTRCSRRLA